MKESDLIIEARMALFKLLREIDSPAPDLTMRRFLRVVAAEKVKALAQFWADLNV
jgi:hypothetical protein